MRLARGWLVLSTLVLVVAATVRFHLLPGDVPIDAAPEVFSAVRAHRDVATLAVAPRPAGSPAHAAARAWLVERLTAMGLEVDQRPTLAVSSFYGMPFDTGRVRNVVGRLRGRATEGSADAVLLVAHYDTVVGSAGASDDAAGVAVALEVVRAVQSGPPLDADLMVLFTDLEEGGMVGAHAFVKAHPDARRVRAFINLDARGTSGAPVVVGLADPQGALLAGAIEARCGPALSSMYVEATKLLHGGTDFAVLAGSGLAGVNVAFADGVSRYHTGGDVPAALDTRTLQAEGDLALGLVRSWSRGRDARPAPRLREVYFALPVLGVVTLPALAIRGSVALLVGLAGVAIHRRRAELRPRRVALHAAATIGLAAGAGLAAWCAWRAVVWLHPVHAAMRVGDPYDVEPLRIAAVTWGLGAAFGGGAIAARFDAHGAERDAGALAVGVIVAGAFALAAPAAGFALVAPVLAALLACCVRSRNLRRVAAMLAAAVVALFGTPIVYAILIALELPRAGVAVFVVVLLASWTPGLLDVRASAARGVALTCAAVALVLVLASSLTTRFDAAHPRPTCATYRVDDGEGEATWWTDEPVPSPSTRRLVAEPAAHAPDAALAPWGVSMFASPAPRLAIPTPEITVLAERTADGARALTLRVRSRRRAPWMYVTAGARVRSAAIEDGGVELALPANTDEDVEPWSFRHVDPDDAGLVLELEVVGREPFELHVTDQSFELPPPADGPRDPAAAACRSWWADSTLATAAKTL